MSKHIPRIYCSNLDEEYFDIPQFQIIHLTSVLRLKIGDNFIAFNERSGEWYCKISELNKRKVIGRREKLLRSFNESKLKLALAFCIIKKDNLRFIIEKGAELGVNDFYPLSSKYSSNIFDNEKLNYTAILATEQSERLDIPEIHKIQNIDIFLKNLPNEFKWFSAIERQNNLVSLDDANIKGVNSGFIIGPEGGFSNDEKELLMRNTMPVCLSNNILRAETAALTCLAVFNSKNLELRN